MTTLDEAVGLLMEDPKPILCLDTCDILSVIESVKEERSNHAAPVRRLVTSLIAGDRKCQPVITYLVNHEWRQNVERVKNKASDHLRGTDRRVKRIVECCGHVEIGVQGPSDDFATLPLIENLVELAESLMARAITLGRDDGCIEKALERVMLERRPSRRGAIKDSIHMEHYLELSRRLGPGFREPRLFVSANKNDFWEGQPRLHPELKEDFSAAGLEFFGKLDAALGRLRV